MKDETEINMKGQEEIPNSKFSNRSGFENIQAVCPGPVNFHFNNSQGSELFVLKFVYFHYLKVSWDLM